MTVADPGVVVEAVKLADDRSGDVVVRLYEARGGRARTTLTTGFPVRGVSAVNLLEEDYEEAPELLSTALTDGVEGSPHRVELSLRPFQILTLRLER